MKRPRMCVLVSVALGVCAVISACGKPSGPQQVEYHMDYPMYATINEMCKSASLVVTGTVVGTEVRKVNILAADQGDTPEENPALGAGESPDDAFIVETVSTFKIDQVVRGTLRPGDVVEVGQPGGLFEGVNYVADQYAMRAGETHLLFLQEFDDVPANLLNPSQAGFKVTAQGMISPASDSSLVDAVSNRKVEPAMCS